MSTSPRLALRSCLAAALCTPLAAYATGVITVPEPDAWALLGLGVAAAAIAAIRKRRK